MVEIAAGTTLSGRYRLETPLGRGSTSAVWRARDVELGREVAVKVLRGDGVDPALASRFEREGVILGRLSHPNLVPVLATGRDDGVPYLVMELVDGAALSERLRDGPLPADEAVDLVAEVAAGLGAAHRAGVVHRDVKPGNILCPTGGPPRLVDFGIARAGDLTSMTAADTVLGTAAYLSPEQARGEVPGPASDVYALGCVLYELLEGRPPFPDDNPVTVAYRHVHDHPPAPTSAPPEVAAVLARCLAKEPSTRYPSAVELEAALRGTPVEQHATAVLPLVVTDDPDPEPLPFTPAGRRDRRLLLGALAAAAVVVLLAVAALGDGGGQDPAGADDATTTTAPTTTTTTTTLPPPPPVEIDDDEDEERDDEDGRRKGRGKKDDD